MLIFAVDFLFSDTDTTRSAARIHPLSNLTLTARNGIRARRLSCRLNKKLIILRIMVFPKPLGAVMIVTRSSLLMTIR